MYATGIDWIESAVRELASNASLAGIQVNLEAESFGDVVNTAFGSNGESWELADWGSWTYAPDYLPTGDSSSRPPRPTTSVPTTTPTTTS